MTGHSLTGGRMGAICEYDTMGVGGSVGTNCLEIALSTRIINLRLDRAPPHPCEYDSTYSYMYHTSMIKYLTLLFSPATYIQTPQKDHATCGWRPIYNQR